MRGRSGTDLDLVARLRLYLQLGQLLACRSVIRRPDYDEVAADYDRLWTARMGRYPEKLIGRIRLGKGRMRVLDLGCGTGFGTLLLAGKSNRVTILAVDLSRRMLQAAVKKAHDKELKNVEFREGDILTVLKESEDEEFHLITSFWVLPYINAKRLLAECRRVLKVGGQVALITSQRRTLWPIQQAFARFMKHHPGKVIKIMKIYMPEDSRALRRAFSRAGFAVEAAWDGEVQLGFASAEEAIEWLRSCGVLTGFDKMIEKDVIGELWAEIKRSLEEAGRAVLTYRFVALIATKK